MQVSAIRRTPSTARGSRCRLTIARRAVALTGLGWRNSSSTVEPSRITSPSWTGAAVDRLAVQERRVPGAEEVALAVADQGRVVPRQVAHERDVGVAVGAGAAQDDLVVEADEVTADGVDPEQEAAPRPRLARPGQGPRRGRRGGSRALVGVGVGIQEDDRRGLGQRGVGRGLGPRSRAEERRRRPGAAPRGPGGRGADRGDLLPGAAPRLARGRVLGDDLEHGLGGRQDLGPAPRRQRGVERLDLGRGGLLPRLQVATGGGQGRLRRARGEPLGAVELVVGAAELAPPRLVQRRLPRLGDLAGPPQRRAADLVPRQVLDPLDDAGRLARVEVGADLAGEPDRPGSAAPRPGRRGRRPAARPGRGRRSRRRGRRPSRVARPAPTSSSASLPRRRTA